MTLWKLAYFQLEIVLEKKYVPFNKTWIINIIVNDIKSKNNWQDGIPITIF